MANLVIDVGNSFTKIGVFDGTLMLWADHLKELSLHTFQELKQQFKLEKVIISSVKKQAVDWHSLLGDNVLLKYFTAGMDTGISNHYKTPHTLGLDRLAAVIGAMKLFPGEPNLVIDAGTCITYDWIDGGGNYFGGSISPGVIMRYKALNYYTDGLPMVDPVAEFDHPFGDDTVTAMLSGVQNGIKYELKGFIESYFSMGEHPNIILTGGDGIFFDTLLKNSIFAPYIKNEPYLVLKGLNAAIQGHND